MREQMTTSKPIALIVATLLPNMGIGYKNALPWRLRNEMKYFKTVTSTAPAGLMNAVIMGRNTWESIPNKFRPLPGRLNVVITRSPGENTGEVQFFTSLESAMSALDAMAEIHKVFVMGGAQLYNYCLSKQLVPDLLVTEVTTAGELPPMDTFLDRELIVGSYTRQPSESLHKFLGTEVAGKQQEGDYQYEYTLYSLNK